MRNTKIISLVVMFSILMSCMSNALVFAESGQDTAFSLEMQADEGVPAQPVDQALVNDKKMVRFDAVVQDNDYEVGNDFYAQKKFLSDISLKDKSAVSYLHSKYQQRFGDISAQNKMAEVFTSEELDTLSEINKLFSIEDMYMLYILCVNDINMTDNLSEEMKSLVLSQNSIYSVLLAYLSYQRTGEGYISDYIINDEGDQNIALLSDSQTGNSYELYNQKKYENKYYQPLDGGISIGDVTGNVVYTHTPVSVPGKNGFDLTLTATYDSSKAMGIRYEWEEGDVAYSGPGFRWSVDGNLFGTGWSFNVTHIIGDEPNYYQVMLEDGRVLPVKNNNIYPQYEFDDIDIYYLKSDKCYVVKYLNGTTEYIKDKYIYKKTDKYGNNIYYEYDTPENIHNVTTQSSVRLQKNLTKMYDDMGRTINIDYYDNQVVVTRPDGSTVEYFRHKIHVDGVGKAEKLSISDDIPVITGVYDRSSQTSYCDLEYTTSEICFYHGNIAHSITALCYGLYMLPSRFRAEHGPDYTFTYTKSFYEKPAYGMGVGSFNVSVKNLNIDGKPCKEYSYSAGKENLQNWTQKTTSVTSDNLVTEFLNNSRNNSYAVNTYVHQGDTDILCKEMVHNSKYEYMLSQPTDVTVRQYNSNGNYIEQKTTYEYNTHGQPIKEVTTIDGEEYQTKEYQYSDNIYSSLLDEAVKKGGRTVYNVIYNVDACGNVTKEFLNDTYRPYCDIFKTVLYEYDSNHNLIKKSAVKEDGTVVQCEEYTYDSNGLYPASAFTKDSSGSIITKNTYTYDFNTGNQLTVNNTKGTTTYGYNELGRLTMEKHPDDTAIYINYYDPEESVGVINEDGYHLEYFYTGEQVKKVEEYKYGVLDYHTLQTAEYDVFSRPTKVTDAEGNNVTISYDAFGRQTSAQYPPINGVTPNPICAKYYDVFLEGDKKYSMSMLITQEDKISCKYYDALGRLVKTTAISNPSVLLAHEDIDDWYQMPSDVRIVTTSTIEYDDVNRTVTETDGEGRQTVTVYDVDGSVYSVTQGSDDNKSVVTYEYNDAGNVISMNYNGHITKYEYDLAGRLIKTTDPMGLSETTEYDMAGNPIKVTDKNGVTATNTYNARGQLTKTQKGSQSVSYTYDKVGRVLTQVGNTGIISYEYNIDGTLKQVIQNGKTLTYDSYDGNKQLTQFTDYFGNQTNYEYTGGSYIASITSGSDKTSYTYYMDGTLEEANYPNGNQETYTYNYRGLVQGVSHMSVNSQMLKHFSYTYNKAGNIMLRSVTGNGGVTKTLYKYDSLGRLTKETKGTEQADYSYDKCNNISEINRNGKQYSLSYDANNRLINESIVSDAGTENINYNYDNNGNMISRMSAMIQPADDSDASAASIALMGGSIEAVGITRGTALYGYDEFNRLTSYSDLKGNSAEYTYYADGLRKSKTVGEDTTEYYYNGQNVINETKNASEYATNIIGVNGYICRTQDGITGYFLRDGHGDIQTAYAEDRTTKLADYTYDAWGNQNNTEALSWGENNPIRYAGQYYDTESGMFYLRARYYDSSMGRFISADPHWNPDNMIYGDIKKQNSDSFEINTYDNKNEYHYKTHNGHKIGTAELKNVQNMLFNTYQKPSIDSILQSSNLYSYVINNPIKYFDESGEGAETTIFWSGSTWWLVGVDGPLPVGDAVFILGVGACVIIDGVIYFSKKSKSSAVVN